MTRLTTVFVDQGVKISFLLFPFSKPSFISRRDVSVRIADGCDMQSTTDDYRIRSHERCVESR